MINATTPVRGRGRPRSFDTADAVQKAALVFWRHGYEGTSVEQLRIAMGITTQSLYAAFGSKAALYRQALAWYEQDAVLPARQQLEEPDVAKAIKGTLEELVRRFTRPSHPRGCMRSAAMVHCAPEHDELAAYLASQRAETEQAFKARLDKAVQEGQLSKKTRVAECAGFLNAVISGMSVAAQDGATAAELLPYAAMATRSLEVLRTSRGRSI